MHNGGGGTRAHSVAFFLVPRITQSENEVKWSVHKERMLNSGACAAPESSLKKSGGGLFWAPKAVIGLIDFR